jgi:hypothetical protein
MNELMIGATVAHPDRDDLGTVLIGNAPAWTPNDLTVKPPDGGMVKVRWFDSVDATQIYWEYAALLRPVEVHST